MLFFSLLSSHSMILILDQLMKYFLSPPTVQCSIMRITCFLLRRKQRLLKLILPLIAQRQFPFLLQSSIKFLFPLLQRLMKTKTALLLQQMFKWKPHLLVQRLINIKLKILLFHFRKEIIIAR